MKKVQKDQPDRKGQPVQRDQLDPRDQLVQRDQLDQKEILVHKAHKVNKVAVAKKDKREVLVQKV